MLVPEEILHDHPERLRALIVEGSNPLLSFPDTQRWLEAREHLDLLVVIEPTMTETALVADYILPTPTGYEKWEMASFPRGYPPRPCRRSCAPPSCPRRVPPCPKAKSIIGWPRPWVWFPRHPRNSPSWRKTHINPRGPRPI